MFDKSTDLNSLLVPIRGNNYEVEMLVFIWAFSIAVALITQ